MTFQNTGSETGRPLTDLVGGLVSDISGLFRKEIELAKVEAGEKISDAMKAGRSLAIGGILAIGAIGVFLAACVTGLTALFLAMGMAEPIANLVAALIVAIVVGAIAWAMIGRGLNDLNASKLSMERTAHAIRMDAATVRETL